MRVVNIAAVILAAGASTRLGRPKQNIVLGGETLVERAIRIADEALFKPVIVVARQGAELADVAAFKGAVVVINHDADEGIASSIRCGVLAAAQHGVAGIVLMTCDQPGIEAGHLRRLVEDEERITGSAYAGIAGVPAYFPASSFSVLLELRGDTGARALLRNAHSISAPGLELDIDTEQDLEAARQTMERG
ncbi:MAG TPA: nucleotidyltransferase family protein [Acidobacteriaceae bacterium]